MTRIIRKLANRRARLQNTLPDRASDNRRVSYWAQTMPRDVAMAAIGAPSPEFL